MSKPQVTITLGQTGQVVTRGGKRYRGSNGDGYLSSNNTNKRLRGNGSKWNPGVDQVNGSQIARNDLRLKLNRKRALKRVQNNGEDRKTVAREKLLNPVDPPRNSYMLPHRADPNLSNLSRRIPSNSIANDGHRVDSWGNFHSSQTMGRPRTGSPDRTLKSSSMLSRSTSIDEMQKVSWTRPADDPRGGRFFSKEALGPPRQTGSVPLTMKAPAPAANPLTRVAPTSGTMQNISHMGEEPRTVSGFLQALGLGKYAIHFQAEEVDMTVLKQMRDNDLKEMGIPMGPRKKILLALLPRQKQQPPRLHH